MRATRCCERRSATVLQAPCHRNASAGEAVSDGSWANSSSERRHLFRSATRPLKSGTCPAFVRRSLRLDRMKRGDIMAREIVAEPQPLPRRTAEPEVVREAFGEFRANGTVTAAAVDVMIEDSWKRCLTFGLDESRQPDFAQLSSNRLVETREQNRLLAAHALPVMENLYQQIVDTESMLLLTDANGLILHSLGDDSFLQRADKVALRPGVSWSEKAKGTNAIGTAIVTQAPTLVHGNEHFFSANHFLTCS